MQDHRCKNQGEIFMRTAIFLSALFLTSCSTMQYNYSCPDIKKKGVPCRPSSEIEKMIVESSDPMKEDLFIPPTSDTSQCRGGSCSPREVKGDLQPKKGFYRVYVPKKGKEREYMIYFDREDPDSFFIDEA